MSDQPRDLTLEQINRLSQAVADMMESNNEMGRTLLRVLEFQGNKLERIEGQLQSLTKEVRDLTHRLLRTNDSDH